MVAKVTMGGSMNGYRKALRLLTYFRCLVLHGKQGWGMANIM